MDILALGFQYAPLLFKYGPLLWSFLETEGPGVQAFFADVNKAVEAAKKPDGSLDWVELLPIIAKYAPQAITFLEQQGVQLAHVVADIQAVMRGAQLASPAPFIPAVAVPGLTGPVKSS